MWKGTQPNFFDLPKPQILFGGPATWHGMGRTYPLVAAGNILVPVPLFFAFALPEPGEGLLFWVPAGLSVAALVVILLLAASVHFFNVGKWMVPPHRRAEPGAIREWRNARRERREASPTEEPAGEPGPSP